MSIVTFYSYKGGVGRSMALANIAVLLAKRGLRVLAVDWDLEAPGLERYFSYFRTEVSGGGLLNLLMEKHNEDSPEWDRHLWRIEGEVEGKDFSLHLLPSGKEADDAYAAKLERFEWDSFFADGGGDYLESLREEWRKTYDVTLIDSRTGLSDAGGICTIQLPDIVVAMFTANYQSLYGVRDIMRAAQAARNNLAYDRMHLAVVPLPARFGSRTEFRESQEWLGQFAEVLDEFYKDWLPNGLDPRHVVEVLKVPQVDFFGFGEKLAVMEQGTSDPDGMGFIYDRVASLLANDLDDAELVLKIEGKIEHRQARSVHKEGYEYDLYVSYGHQPIVYEVLRGFVDELRSMLGLEIGRDPTVFLDYNELGGGDVWAEKTHSALSRAKLLLAFLTPRYFTSEWCTREWATFAQREQVTQANGLIFPIVLRESEMPAWAVTRTYWDMSELLLGSSSKRRSLKTRKRVLQLAGELANRLRDVPQFDPDWTVLEPPRTKTHHGSFLPLPGS